MTKIGVDLGLRQGNGGRGIQYRRPTIPLTQDGVVFSELRIRWLHLILGIEDVVALRILIHLRLGELPPGRPMAIDPDILRREEDRFFELLSELPRRI